MYYYFHNYCMPVSRGLNRRGGWRHILQWVVQIAREPRARSGVSNIVTLSHAGWIPINYSWRVCINLSWRIAVSRHYPASRHRSRWAIWQLHTRTVARCPSAGIFIVLVLFARQCIFTMSCLKHILARRCVKNRRVVDTGIRSHDRNLSSGLYYRLRVPVTYEQ